MFLIYIEREEGLNYADITLSIITQFYNFQLDNIFKKLVIGLKYRSHMQNFISIQNH